MAPQNPGKTTTFEKGVTGGPWQSSLQTMRVLRFVVLGVGLCLTGCFDYVERIVFREDFGGYVQFSYRVPVYPEQERSMIAFLPVSRSRIEARYESLIREGRVRLADFEISIEEASGDNGEVQDELFRRTALVRYRVYFDDPVVLEDFLPGRTVVIVRQNRLNIRRAFPLSRAADEEDRLMAIVQRLSSKVLSDHTMTFYVSFPPYYESSSAQGFVSEPGVRGFILPLERTVTAKESDDETVRTTLAWAVTITRAPPPGGRRGTAEEQRGRLRPGGNAVSR